MDSRMNRVGAVAASMCLLVVALVGASVLSGVVPTAAHGGRVASGQDSSGASVNFDQIVVVAMENKNLYDVYQNSAAPYENGLGQGVATHWQSVMNPSQPNYIAVIGGNTFNVTSNSDTPHLPYHTIVDILENTSKTWKAFAEDASGTGCDTNPPRGDDHFPFISYTTITNDPARCANIQPGSSNEVISALEAGVNFIWLTPNDCNNTHSCSVSTGDAWLESWVPQLLSAMTGKRAVLLLWWDEAYASPPYIPLFLAGTAVKTNHVSANEYNHYSLLKLIEDVWGGGNLGQGDVTAPSPLEFFNPGGPDFTLSASPATVSFVTGQSAISTVSFTANDGFTGTIDLTAASSPAGVTTSCAPSNISGGQTSTCTLTGSTPGSYTVTVTGTNGSLVHTTSISVTVTAPANPDFSITANPNTVSFVPGQSAVSTTSLQSTGGFNGAVALTAASTPAGVTTLCVPARISGTQTSACTMGGTTAGSYTVVVTGTNGTLSHTASIDVTVAAAGPPTARFTFAPPYPQVNNSVAFDASSSTDPDPSATLQARWDWEGDGVWDTPWSSTLTVQHSFTNAGVYVVKLEILDSHGLTDRVGQWVAVQNPGGGDKTPPQVAIVSPSNDTVIASANVTVTGVAWDNVALSTIQLSTDNATWTATFGTTSWSGSVLLNAGMNHIYARAIDTSGNVRTAVITVIADHSAQGVPSALADPTVPILLGMSPVVALAAIHAFLWNRTRTRGHGPKKKTEMVPDPEKGDVGSSRAEES